MAAVFRGRFGRTTRLRAENQRWGIQLFEGFESQRIVTRETEINLKIAGNGPPLLLLHGYPQTHIIWHRIAPTLSETHTVVATDLRGYGDSGKPPSDYTHTAYSKRAMAADQVEVMAELGFATFCVAGHDRGARVAHRMVRDHPDRVEKIAVLDIAPTATMYTGTDKAFATAYYHWFFLIQPFDLPERMIGADPEFYLSKKLRAWGRTKDAITDAQCGIPALLFRPCYHPRHLRGLSRLSHR